jgi:alpha 1,2-mannosyltransferase
MALPRPSSSSHAGLSGSRGARGARVLRYLVTALALLAAAWAITDMWSGQSDPTRFAHRVSMAAAARWGAPVRRRAEREREGALIPKSVTTPAVLNARRAVALIVLARESEAGDLVKTMHSFDEAYNAKFQHDYIVFIDEVWAASSIAVLTNATKSRVRLHLLDTDCVRVEGRCEWGMPAWIDRRNFSNVLKEKTYYGNTENYRKMCRFFAGPMFSTLILDEYKFAWRLDSHVRYLCDIVDDPIARMEKAGAVYGFALRMVEKMDTIPTLWPRIEDWAVENGRKSFMREQWGLTVPGHTVDRGCHYWNNFEIVSIDFFRDKGYQSLFHTLDASGGFFYERWGDAPVRSWALSALARKDQVIYFEEVGYQHPWWFKCPPKSAVCWRKGVPMLPTSEGEGAGCLPDPEIQPWTYTDGNMCSVPS